ncbi:hypothetical protein [Octadecabacter antarcticus]|uniref:hypothetical protein n=1 Tax=Octadecabacter antarcticus TaxID=1217908 RepID=UPI0001806A83|nr:hypothetical protein [Octadecabacter antarcticus]
MFDYPTTVMDLNRVVQQYHALKAGLGAADIHYAVKANPAPETIARLVDLGSHFDAASRGEIELGWPLARSLPMCPLATRPNVHLTLPMRLPLE